MSLDLPKFGLHVCSVPVTSLDAELVERGKNWNKLYLAVSFEVCLETHVEIFCDGLFEGVPETNFFDEGVTEGVIGEGESDAAAGDLIGSVERAVHVIVGPDNDWDLGIVSGIDLGRLVNEIVAVLKVAVKVIFYLVKVAVWRPAVCIYHCHQHVFLADHKLVKLLFHMFHAPRHIRSLAFLLEGTQFVHCEINVPEF